MSGSFPVLDPELGFEIHASTLVAARERATQSGVATQQEIDSLVLSLRQAKGGEYSWVAFPMFLDLLLRKPSTA
jgi:hypothetical protein